MVVKKTVPRWREVQIACAPKQLRAGLLCVRIFALTFMGGFLDSFH